jgi:hypothetical protein
MLDVERGEVVGEGGVLVLHAVGLVDDEVAPLHALEDVEVLRARGDGEGWRGVGGWRG